MFFLDSPVNLEALGTDGVALGVAKKRALQFIVGIPILIFEWSESLMDLYRFISRDVFIGPLLVFHIYLIHS